MSKTWKDKPDKYRNDEDPKRKPKQDRRFESTKGRKNTKIKLEDYLLA